MMMVCHLNCDATLQSVNLMKRNSQLKSLKDLVPAYPSGIKINYLKYRDMSQLLKYIPPVHHDFQKSMTKAMRMNFFLKMCRLAIVKVLPSVHIYRVLCPFMTKLLSLCLFCVLALGIYKT